MTRPVDTYTQALDFLFHRINYERIQSTSYSVGDLKLSRMRSLLDRLRNPEAEIPAVHIAGTKGKGSTATMVASLLAASGYRVGLFTSPHLTRFEERMTVNGRMPTEDEVVALVNELLEPVAELDQQLGGMNPTYFEITTAMAWLYFRQQQAEIVVLEVGLGGRLDATNLCRPEVCVITSISRDHTHLLGSDIDQIAREKGGIIKSGVPILSGVTNSPAREAIAEIAAQRESPLIQLGEQARFTVHETGTDGTMQITVQTPQQVWTEIPVPLLGEHQAHNTALAILAVDQLRQRGWNIPAAVLAAGPQGITWPARMEVVAHSPTVIIDAAHNWAAVQALLQGLERHFPGKNRVLLFAATRDKDVLGMLRLLLPAFDTVILTCYQSNPRTVPVDQLQAMAASVSQRPTHVAPDPLTAWDLAQRLARPNDLICITGSFFIAAELRDVILSVATQPCEPSSNTVL